MTGMGPWIWISARSFSAHSVGSVLQGEDTFGQTPVGGTRWAVCPSPWPAHAPPTRLHVHYLRKGCRQERTVTTMSWLREVRRSVLLPTGLGALRVRKATHAVMNCSCGGGQRPLLTHSTWVLQYLSHRRTHTHACTYVVFPDAVHDPGVQLQVLPLGGKAGQINNKGELGVVEQGEECLQVLHHIQHTRELRVVLRAVRVEVPVGYRIAHQLTHHRWVRLRGGDCRVHPTPHPHSLAQPHSRQLPARQSAARRPSWGGWP